MTKLVFGDITVRCRDGVTRICPPGLADEVERVFGLRPDQVKPLETPTGSVIGFPNGVKVRLFNDDDLPSDRAFDMATVPHVVLRGPKPGWEDVPPFVDGEVVIKEERPIPHLIQVIDVRFVGIAEDRNHPWLVAWPGINEHPKYMRLATEALAELQGIHIKVKCRKIREGVWYIGRNGKYTGPNPNIKKVSGARKRGSKYPWADLKPGVPVGVMAPSQAALIVNFHSWAKGRGITWKLKTRSMGDGVYEVTWVEGSSATFVPVTDPALEPDDASRT